MFLFSCQATMHAVSVQKIVDTAGSKNAKSMRLCNATAAIAQKSSAPVFSLSRVFLRLHSVRIIARYAIKNIRAGVANKIRNVTKIVKASLLS